MSVPEVIVPEIYLNGEIRLDIGVSAQVIVVPGLGTDVEVVVESGRVLIRGKTGTGHVLLGKVDPDAAPPARS